MNFVVIAFWTLRLLSFSMKSKELIKPLLFAQLLALCEH